MSFNILISLWVRPFILSALLLVLTFFLYVSIRTPRYSQDGSKVPPSPSDGATMQSINAALNDLEVPLDEPIATFNFAAKGDRVAALADLVTIFQSHGIAIPERFDPRLSGKSSLGGNQIIMRFYFRAQEDRPGLWFALAPKIHCSLGILFERCAMFSDRRYLFRLLTQEMTISPRRIKRLC